MGRSRQRFGSRPEAWVRSVRRLRACSGSVTAPAARRFRWEDRRRSSKGVARGSGNTSGYGRATGSASLAGKGKAGPTGLTAIRVVFHPLTQADRERPHSTAGSPPKPISASSGRLLYGVCNGLGASSQTKPAP